MQNFRFIDLRIIKVSKEEGITPRDKKSLFRKD